MSNAILSINNREMKSESGFSLAMASQPLQSKDENWWEIFAYGLQYQKIFQHHSVLLEDYCLNSVFDI